MTQVYFFRGLSTNGRDYVKFSFMNWGLMYAHLQRDMKPLGVELHPIVGMGRGTFDEQAQIAAQLIRQHQSGKIHLLGHSAGGLIALKMLSILTPDEVQNVLSLVTIATPHKGSRLAQACLDAPQDHPYLVKILKILGYDVTNSAKFYAQLTAQAIDEQFKDLKVPTNTHLASIVCGPPKEFWSWPVKTAHWLPALKKVQQPSDGLLETESQTFGHVLGHFNLDHLCQLGVYQKPEYFKMCKTLAEYWKSLESSKASSSELSL